MAVETSYPDINVTGPIHWFMRTPAHSNYSGGSVATKIWYLGTCETKPQSQITKYTLDVFNDLGGRKVPFQKIVQGESGVLGLALNRYSIPAYDALCTAGGLDSTDGSLGKGSETSLSRGSLVFGKTSVELWGLNTFYRTTNDPYSVVKKGRYYTCACLEMHEKVKQGTEEDLMLLAFSVQNRWQGLSGGVSNLGFRAYYEGNDAAFWPTDVSLANIQ